MIYKEGQYYYAPHRSSWGIWLISGSNSGTFIKDCASRDEARREVYRLNGWNTNF